MNNVKKIAKNTSILFISEILNKILTFAYTIFMVRHLGAEGFGMIAFAMAFTGIFAIFIDFGLSQLSVRDISRDISRANKYLSNVLSLKIILSVIISLCIIIILNIMDNTQEIRAIVYIFTLQIIVMSFNQTFYSIYQSYEHMEYIGMGKIIYSISAFIGILFSIFLDFDVIIFASIFLISSIINILFCFGVALKKYRLRRMEFDLVFWNKILKDTIPFGLSGMFVIVYFNTDSIMISLINGNEYVGWYNAAYRLVLTLVIMPALITTSILPAMAKSIGDLNNLKNIYYSSFKLLFVIATPLFVGVMSFSNEIIALMFGADFVPAINALRILSFLIPIIFITYLSGNLLAVSNKQNYLCKIVMLNAIFNILLNLYLIPKYNIIGASISTVLTEFLGLILMMHCISKNFFKLSFNLITSSLLSGVFMFLIIYFLKEYVNWIFLGIFGSMAYAVMLFLVDKQIRNWINMILNNIKELRWKG